MNSEIEKQLWEKAHKYARFLRYVPFVKMVAVCNNLAFGNVNSKSDIDLFIIAGRGRLYLVRTMITVLLQVMGVRRHGKNVFGRFCLSFFVDEDGMDLSKIAIDNDLYLKFWIQTMVPIVDDNVYFEFIGKNPWVGDFELMTCKSQPRFDWNNGVVGNFFERILKSWQMNRAQKKALKIDPEVSSLIITDHILKFHNIDRRREYRDKWVSEGVKTFSDL